MSSTKVILDGEEYAIDHADPNHDLLVEFAGDTEARKKLKQVGITDLEKQKDYYLKYHKPAPEKKIYISEEERIALEAKPSTGGIGVGKRDEELQRLLENFHRVSE